MNFFNAVRNATFASKLFSAAGFDFEAAIKANNETALKAHIDAAVAAAKPGEPTAEQTRILNEAVAENARIAADLAQAKKDIAAITEARAAAIAQAEALTASVEASAFKITDAHRTDGKVDAAKFKAAHDLHIATLVRTECAKVGVKPVVENLTASPEKAKAPEAKPDLHGRALYRDAISKDLAAIHAKAAV